MENIKLKNLPGKILIIKPSSLGDIVHSLPFLNALRERFPKAEIHWIVAEGFEGLLEGHPMINKLWIIKKDSWKKIKNVKGTLIELAGLFRSLKKEKFDIAVDLQGLLRSGIIAAASGAPVRIGFREAKEGSGIFYTHRIMGIEGRCDSQLDTSRNRPSGKDIHAVDRYLKIADFLGCDTNDVRFPFPLSSVSFNLPPDGKYAVIVPGARWLTKMWPPERFGELASVLPIKFFVIGGKSDIETADRVIKSSKGNAVSLAGKTNIKELIEIMRGARFIVSNDSGPMHIAAALGIPVFAVFGPTNPARTGPYGSRHTIIRKEIKCSPCYKRNCRDLKCMNLIDVATVADLIEFNCNTKNRNVI